MTTTNDGVLAFHRFFAAFNAPHDPAVDGPPSPNQPRFVYFCRRPDGKIKIGVSANPVIRVKSLRTQGGFKSMKLLACFRGSEDDEAELHRRFAGHRVVGEWFTSSPDLNGVIKAMLKEHGDPTKLVTSSVRSYLDALAKWKRATLGVRPVRFAYLNTETAR
jgi:hypothetical protein